MAKKKKIKEQDKYDVTLSKDDIISPDDVETTVTAKDSADAVEQAKKNNVGEYDNIQIKKSGGAGNRVRTEPMTRPNTTPRTSLESVQYPYHIGLPTGFKPLVESLTKKTQEAITITERFSRLHITISNAKSMKIFVEEINKKSRGRAKVKGMAGVVRNGIMESI